MILALAFTTTCTREAARVDTAGAERPALRRDASVGWRHVTDMPTARAGAAAFAVRGRLVVIGGQDEALFLSANEMFDTLTRSWTRGAPLRLGRTFSSTNSAAIGEAVHLMAGNPRGYCTNAADAFDVAFGTWRLLPGAPVARCHAASVAVNGRVYVIGGWNTSSTTFYRDVDVFDPSTNAWSQDSALPAPRGGMSAAAIGESIYLVGGWTPADPMSNLLQAFDVTTHRWMTKAPMPTPRSAAAAAEIAGRLYVIGGIRMVAGKPTFTDVVESYHPETNSWRTEPSLPSPTAYASAVALGSTLYLIGGRNDRDGASLRGVLSFTP